MKNSSYSMIQRKYYDTNASGFDRRGFYCRENRNHYKKIAWVLEIAKKSKSRNILEIGIGTGIHAKRFIHDMRIEFQYIGVDISYQMLRIAQGRLQTHDKINKEKRVDLITADALYLPFKESSFDLVFCSGTLHHISEPQSAINEMIRVLKTRGRLVIIEPQPFFPTTLLATLINPNVERNVLKMTRRNFTLWTNDILRKVEINNLLYTPPYPKSFSSFYDKVDLFLSKIPLLRSFSIMLFLTGEK